MRIVKNISFNNCKMLDRKVLQILEREKNQSSQSNYIKLSVLAYDKKFDKIEEVEEFNRIIEKFRSELNNTADKKV